MRLALKVVAGAARTDIAGWLGDHLKVRVSAAPERGAANAAVVALLARTLNVPNGTVRIVAGAGSARKVVEINGLSAAEVHARLGRHTT